MPQIQEPEIKQQVARVIREARKARGLTQQEVADKLGVSKGTYNRYEDEESNLSIETIGKIATVFGAKPKLIFE